MASDSNTAFKFVFFDNSFVGLVRTFDPIVKRVALWRQKLSDLVHTGRGVATAIIHQLAYLVFVAAHIGLL